MSESVCNGVASSGISELITVYSLPVPDFVNVNDKIKSRNNLE